MEKEKLDKMYDICFFDLDGTIIDSSPGITNSVMYALEKFGIEETEREGGGVLQGILSGYGDF